MEGCESRRTQTRRFLTNVAEFRKLVTYFQNYLYIKMKNQRIFHREKILGGPGGILNNIEPDLVSVMNRMGLTYF